jgi:cell division protein FtsL
MLFILLLAGALAWIIFTLVGSGGATRSQLARQLEQLQEENRRQQEENFLLRLEIEALKNRPEYVESQARKLLGLVGPGEIIVILPEEGEPTPVPQGGRDGGH